MTSLRLQQMASLAAGAVDEGVVCEALALVRSEVAATEVFLVYGAPDRYGFNHFSSGGPLELGDTALWIVDHALSSMGEPCSFELINRRVVGFREATVPRAYDYVASALPFPHGVGEMLLVKGPWATGLEPDALAFISAAGPALELIIERRLNLARAERDELQLSALASISRVISQGEDLEAMLSQVARSIAAVTALDYVTMDIFDSDGGVALRCVSYDLPLDHDEWKRALRHRDPVRDAVVSTRQPMVFPEAQTDDRIPESGRRFFMRTLVRSAAVLPLNGKERVVGTLAVASRRPMTFDGAELKVLEGLADQVASAVEGVRLYEERRQAEAALGESEASFRLLFADNPHPMWVFERDTGGFLEVNAAAIKHYGYSREEFLGLTIKEIRPVEDVPRLEAVQRDGAPQHEGEWRHRLRDGRVIDVYLRASSLTFAGRDAMLVVAEDVTERKRTEQARERLTNIIEATTDLVAMTDRDGRRTYLNRAGRSMLGIADDEDVLDTTMADDRPAWARRLLEEVALPAAKREGAWSGELAYVDRHGREIPVSQVILAHKGQSGDVEFLSTVARDVSERKRTEAQLVHLANHDALTNLFNRRRLGEELDRTLAEARRLGAPCALLLIDVDQFKDVNDSRGHLAGDELLAALAGLVRGSLRDTDIVARQGGDEFVVVLPSTSQDDAQKVAATLVETIRLHTFTVAGSPLRITVSIGMTCFPRHGRSSGELLARADLAMYKAKERGRNQVCAFAPGTDWERRTTSRLDWYNRVREALDRGLFVFHAQPILDLRTKRVSRYELLLRMRDAAGHLTLPGTFLETAERSGFIQDIDRWAMHKAIEVIADHEQAAGNVAFEVNLSGKAFGDPRLLGLIRSELANSHIDPRLLIFEVTETAAISNITEAQTFVRTLKDLGCRFALDDFGIGFSSFYQLKHLPVDDLKIDGSFIRDICHSSVDQHLVRAMVGLAKALGIGTVAEYVNQAEIIPLLEELGVDYAQGFFIGRPASLPSLDIERAWAA